MNLHTYSALISGFLLGAAAAGLFWLYSDEPLTTKSVAEAGKLIGLEYTEEQRERIVEQLRQQPAQYSDVRALELPNNVPLPLYFSPVPPGKQFDIEPQNEIDWRIPEDIELPANRADLAFYSVKELSSLIRNRKISSEELTLFFLDRLERYDEKLEAVVTLTRERALEQARERDRELADGIWRGPLHGIPYGAKDLFAVDGYPTTFGAMPYRDQLLEETATVIRKLDEAGAVLLAKLSLGALAYGDIWFGGRTNNPWNLEQGSSGSSAGSAAAVSAGLLPFSLGTETLGSLISPANRTGITALRPTFGQVSRHGAMALSWTMDKVGPMARTADDAALVFDAIRGPDGYDLTVKEFPFNYDARIDLSGLRVGYYRSAFESDYQNAARDSATLALLRDLGAKLIPVELPDLPTGGTFNLLTAEAAAAFEELTLSGRDSLMVWQDDIAWPNMFRRVRFHPAVEWIQMNRVRSELIRQMDEMMAEVDLYISPSFQGGNLVVTNLTGHPAVVVPNGFTDGGTPTSITFIGHIYDDATPLAVAHRYQEATGFHQKRPPLFLD